MIQANRVFSSLARVDYFELFGIQFVTTFRTKTVLLWNKDHIDMHKDHLAIDKDQIVVHYSRLKCHD